MKKLIGRTEVAQILSVSVRTVVRYEKAGRLKPIYLSARAVRYDVAELENLLKNGSSNQSN